MTRTVWLPLVGFTLVLGGLVVWVGAMVNQRLHPVAVPLAVGTAATIWWIVWRMNPVERPWQAPSRRSGAVVDDRRWRALTWAIHGTRDKGWDTLAPALRDIVVHRLRARHHIDPDTEPQRAAAALPDRLAPLLTDDPPRPRNRRALAAMIEDIEEL
ncbi:MAG: hypothetical protein Q4G43_08570 [Mobilicoccus sp.]|nr:hypothetical protein [Mobilicoccus sp.]